MNNSNDVWEGWGSVILVAGSTLLVILVIGLLAWQGLAIWRARIATAAEVARDEAYRKLAEESTAAQQRNAEEQGRIARELAELRVSVANIERLLREVG